jgi:hypothetical protein
VRPPGGRAWGRRGAGSQQQSVGQEGRGFQAAARGAEGARDLGGSAWGRRVAGSQRRRGEQEKVGHLTAAMVGVSWRPARGIAAEIGPGPAVVRGPLAVARWTAAG